MKGVKAWAGGDPQRLAAMQAFEKISAQSVLNTVAKLRDDINEQTGSTTGSRMFAPRNNGSHKVYGATWQFHAGKSDAHGDAAESR